jgi:hypothetical protein
VQGGGTIGEGGHKWGWGDAGVGWDAHGVGWDAHGMGQAHSAGQGDQGAGSSSVPHWIQKMTLTMQVKQRGMQMTFELHIGLRVGPGNMQLMTQSQCISYIGLTEEYNSVPSCVAMFRKFWGHETLRKVCREITIMWVL